MFASVWQGMLQNRAAEEAQASPELEPELEHPVLQRCLEGTHRAQCLHSDIAPDDIAPSLSNYLLRQRASSSTVFHISQTSIF